MSWVEDVSINDDMSDASSNMFNIAPGGINLGEIMQHYNQPVEFGGNSIGKEAEVISDPRYNIQPLARSSNDAVRGTASNTGAVIKDAVGDNSGLIIGGLFGLAAIGIFMLARKKRSA